MISNEELQKEIISLKERNVRVELDKKWETSFSRRISIAILTYLAIVLFFCFAKLSKPFVNAIVPTLGFLLSTLSLDFIRKRWIKKYL